MPYDFKNMSKEELKTFYLSLLAKAIYWSILIGVCYFLTILFGFEESKRPFFAAMGALGFEQYFFKKPKADEKDKR